MRQYPKHIAAKASLQLPYSEDGIRDYIEEQLRKYKNKTFYNKNLNVNILVTADSIAETAQNCRPNRQAAKLALHLPYILRNAKIKELHLPVISKKQRNRFRFTEIAKMSCNIPHVGIAKIVVGYRKNGEIIEYSITNLQTRNKTSQFEF